MYYLANLPTLQKKLRVMADRTLDIILRKERGKEVIVEEEKHPQ